MGGIAKIILVNVFLLINPLFGMTVAWLLNDRDGTAIGNAAEVLDKSGKEAKVWIKEIRVENMKSGSHGGYSGGSGSSIGRRFERHVMNGSHQEYGGWG